MYRLLTPILAVIVAIAVFTTFIKPTFDSYKRVDKEIADYEGALENAQTLQDRINELIRDKNQIARVDLERLMAFLPDTQEGVSIVLSLDEAAQRNQMVLENIAFGKTDAPADLDAAEESEDRSLGSTAIDPLDEGAGTDLGTAVENASSLSTLPLEEFIEPLDLSFTVTGTYEDFKAFIGDLESSLVLMDISKLAIAESTEDDLASYQVTVSLYEFTNPTE